MCILWRTSCGWRDGRCDIRIRSWGCASCTLRTLCSEWGAGWEVRTDVHPPKHIHITHNQPHLMGLHWNSLRRELMQKDESWNDEPRWESLCLCLSSSSCLSCTWADPEAPCCVSCCRTRRENWKYKDTSKLAEKEEEDRLLDYQRRF